MKHLKISNVNDVHYRLSGSCFAEAKSRFFSSSSSSSIGTIQTTSNKRRTTTSPIRLSSIICFTFTILSVLVISDKDQEQFSLLGPHTFQDNNQLAQALQRVEKPKHKHRTTTTTKFSISLRSIVSIRSVKIKLNFNVNLNIKQQQKSSSNNGQSTSNKFYCFQHQFDTKSVEIHEAFNIYIVDSFSSTIHHFRH